MSRRDRFRTLIFLAAPVNLYLLDFYGIYDLKNINTASWNCIMLKENNFKYRTVICNIHDVKQFRIDFMKMEINT